MEKINFQNIGETLYETTLENGLSIQVLPKSGFNKSYAVFATNYGGADRRFLIDGEWIDTPAGVAHFLEHKMFDTPDGGNALAVLSANGASPNAFTSSSMTAYYYESTEGFYENLRTLLSFVSVGYFTDESVDKEQGIIGQEINMIEDSAGFIVYSNTMKCLFEHNPVRDSVAGSIESIADISAKTLYDCHKIFYNPSNMTLAVVGDVDPIEVEKIANEILPKDKISPPERDYGKKESDLPHKTSVSVNMEVSAPQFLIGARFSPASLGTERLRQRLIGQLALRVLVGKSSPFFSELYAEGLLKQDFSSEVDFTAGSGIFLAGGESSEPETILERFKAHVAKSSDISGEYFERSKKAFFGTRLRALDSFEGICVGLAESKFEQANLLDMYTIINELSLSDIKSFITEVLAPEKLVLSVVNPKNGSEI